MPLRRFSSRHIAAVASHVLDAAVALLLTAVIAVTSAQVIARYVLGTSLPWSEELNRLLFVWMVMLAAARAPHMRIDVFAERLPGRARSMLRLLIAVASLVLLGILVRGAAAMMELTAFDRYTALRVSLQYLFLAPVVGGALWMVVILRDAARELSALRTRSDDGS